MRTGILYQGNWRSFIKILTKGIEMDKKLDIEEIESVKEDIKSLFDGIMKNLNSQKNIEIETGYNSAMYLLYQVSVFNKTRIHLRDTVINPDNKEYVDIGNTLHAIYLDDEQAKMKEMIESISAHIEKQMTEAKEH